MTGSYERREPWSGRAPVGLEIALTTGPGRNWAALWKPLIDAFGPALGEDPLRPFHPHDDRVVDLGLQRPVPLSSGVHAFGLTKTIHRWRVLVS